MESQGGPSAKEFEQMIERKLALAKAGVKDESELSDMQKNTMRALGLLPPLPEPPKQTSRKPARKLEGMPDEIEIDDPTE
jgi:hypothetical protein